MAESTDDSFGIDVTWTIDNFGSWSGNMHGPVLTTEGSLLSSENNLQLELYPRGISGLEEQLVFCLRKRPSTVSPKSGDVSFIASDGSLLCRRERKDFERYRVEVLMLRSGPKFRDVVEHIQKNESLHKDRLTLRFRSREPKPWIQTNKVTDQTHYMNSVVQTFKSTVKIDMERFEEFFGCKECFLMEYPLNNGKMGRLSFTIKEDSEGLKMILGAVKTVKKKFAVRTLMSLLNSDGSVLRSERNEHVFETKEEWVILISDSVGDIEEFVQTGCSMVIDFKIIPRNGHKFLSTQLLLPTKACEVILTKTSRTYQTADVLKTDLMCLYQEPNFSDITLKCDNVSFPVHKNILSARSPVFKTMLSTDMKEAASGVVDIGDLDPSTLSLFLTYLYTGAVELQYDSAFNLYYAADKYQVLSLTRECANFLCGSASIDNVFEILCFGHKHQDDQLKSVSHTLILKNYNKVLASEQWDSFMKRKPLLAAETLTQFAKNKKVKGNAL